MSTEQILQKYLARKVCYLCKSAQSVNRTFCLKCKGPLRLRKQKR